VRVLVAPEEPVVVQEIRAVMAQVNNTVEVAQGTMVALVLLLEAMVQSELFGGQVVHSRQLILVIYKIINLQKALRSLFCYLLFSAKYVKG
jgi:hypothetical protein